VLVLGVHTSSFSPIVTIKLFLTHPFFTFSFLFGIYIVTVMTKNDTWTFFYNSNLFKMGDEVPIFNVYKIDVQSS